MRLRDEYRPAREFEQSWRDLICRLGGRESVAGHSVQGRPLWRFEVGSTSPEAPVVFLSALIHGVEVIGSVALFDVVKRVARPGNDVAERARIVVMPILNPDAFAANMDRLERGWPALQRKNARGVDLNRNFPPVTDRTPWHPFSGSAFRLSPYYRGPHPFSEPESQAVRDVVAGLRPALSLGFHSFGNMLLYPWAWSRDPNPRFPRYSRLAGAFQTALGGMPYRCKQASAFYPTIGDLDDWLDGQQGTTALTVEVGSLDRRLLNPLRLINPFCWMNPSRTRPTVTNLSPGVLALMGAALV